MYVKYNFVLPILIANLAQEQSFSFLLYRIVTVGDFVAVNLGQGGRKISAAIIYMAEVISIASEKVTVRYMRKQGKTLYTWPAEDDYSTQPILDILYILTAPELINARAQFQFLEAEIRHIQNMIPTNKVYFK